MHAAAFQLYRPSAIGVDGRIPESLSREAPVALGRQNARLLPSLSSAGCCHTCARQAIAADGGQYNRRPITSVAAPRVPVGAYPSFGSAPNANGPSSSASPSCARALLCLRPGRMCRSMCASVRTAAFLSLHFLDQRRETTPCRGTPIVTLPLEDDCSGYGVVGGALSKFVNHKHVCPPDCAVVTKSLCIPLNWIHVSSPVRRFLASATMVRRAR